LSINQILSLSVIATESGPHESTLGRPGAIYTVDARGLTGNVISDPGDTGRDANGRMALTVDAHMNANSKEIFERFNKEEV